MMNDNLITFVIVMIAVVVYLRVMWIVRMLPSVTMMIVDPIPYFYFAGCQKY